MLESSIVAKIQGEVLVELPSDLYIPPEYLAILLEEFEGPLDLLLYLIRKKNFDILNIPIRDVTQQYLTYLTLMKQKNRDIAIEYLVMAGTLIEIKSRMLLPRSSANTESEEEDPRLALAQRLLAYEQCQQAAESLEMLERIDRNFWSFSLPVEELGPTVYHCCMREIKEAYLSIIQRSAQQKSHLVEIEPLSIREAMIDLLEHLESKKVLFSNILKNLKTKNELIVYFLAILQLAKDMLISINQEYSFGPIILERRGELANGT
ncbi:segregation/condensation protein A [bacterium]|nr:segregation/condensation protein A [bacterium]NBX71485.1 segregation/condensation protein A [bacterium]